MKSCIKKILGGMSLTCILVMSSCSDDAQLVAGSEVLPENVPASVYEDFWSCFPEAVDVTWSVDDEYVVATFTTVDTHSAASRTSVWYGLKDVKKKMQSRTVAFELLPEAVRNAFASSEYAEWTPEPIADLLIRYVSGTVDCIYVLRATEASEGTKAKKVILYYTADGVLVKSSIKSIYDEDTPILPDTVDEDDSGNDGIEAGNDVVYLSKPEIDAFVLQRYPNATITDKDYDKEELEVELSYNGTKITVLFYLCSQGYVWTGSEWDLDIRHTSTIPAPIQETINGSYAGYHLYFLKYIEKAAGSNYYEVGLKSAQLRQEIKVKMDEQGNVLAEYGRH